MKRLIVVLILFIALLPEVRGQAKVEDDYIIERMVKRSRQNTDRLIEYLEKMEAEIRLLAEIIYWENWHTDKDKRAAYLTGAVVMNRVARDDAWLHRNGEKTVWGVAYAKGQYSTTKLFFTKEIPDECYQMAKDIYLHGTPDVPADVIFQATFKQGPKYDLINGEWFCYG